MAVWLSGGAARIVLRIKVEQEITREGQEFIKSQMKNTITDGELIHWSFSGDCDEDVNLLKSFGYKGPEHLDDADFYLAGYSYYPVYHPKWLQFIDVSLNEKSVDPKEAVPGDEVFQDNFTAVKLRESKIDTVLDTRWKLFNLETDLVWKEWDLKRVKILNDEYLKKNGF